VLRSLCKKELKLEAVKNFFPSMTPSLSVGRKRKRGRREWDEGGSNSGVHGACEPMHQARRGQRGSTHEPGTRLILSLI
jgi:hypothetical protein